MAPLDVPPILRAFVAQLLDPEMVALVRDHGTGQLDIRLSSSRGRVRMRPAITINGATQEMVEPAAVLNPPVIAGV